VALMGALDLSFVGAVLMCGVLGGGAVLLGGFVAVAAAVDLGRARRRRSWRRNYRRVHYR
jgi:hypothetical protein